MYKKFIALLLITTLSGCDKSATDDHMLNDVMKTLKGVQQSVEGLAPRAASLQATASEEVDKLYAIEYKVVEIDNSVDPKAFEKKLVELGAERWECFSIVQTGASYMVTCSRRPASYLRYMLKFLPIPLP